MVKKGCSKFLSLSSYIIFQAHLIWLNLHPVCNPLTRLDLAHMFFWGKFSLICDILFWGKLGVFFILIILILIILLNLMQFLLFFSPAKVSHFCTIFLGYYYILKIRSEFCIVNWCLCKNQWLLFLFLSYQ